MKQYDIVIIGGGIGGLMSALNLISKNLKSKICILEQGNSIEQRFCPASNSKSCQHCKTCSIASGYGGAGAFSDGKFNAGTAYGGTLAEEIGEAAANKYIQRALEILQRYTSEDIQTYGTDVALKTICSQNNLKLLDMQTIHFGTENIQEAMKNLIIFLEACNVDMYTNTTVTDIVEMEDKYKIISTSNDIIADKVIIATGRSGSSLVSKICNKFNIKIDTNSVDIGVRVETLDSIWSHFSSKIYEPKILYRTKTFEDICRMFCFNQGGYVSAENNGGIITANGHSYATAENKSNNCNFAILSSINFTEPFDKPTDYAQSYSKIANEVGNQNIIVQRFGDLIRGRRTTENRLARNFIKPTLKSTAGDLSLVLPYRILTNIIETLYALDRVAPGTANDDTLLYGIESKYYSIKPQHNSNFEIKKNIYLIGDGSGICRGLSQSAAMGLYITDKIFIAPLL